MEKAFNGKGKLPKNRESFDVCTNCRGFGLVKRELKEDMNTSPTISQEKGRLL